MFRKRGENLHSIFVLLFLNVAFYFLEHQDEAKFSALFAFDWPAVVRGQWWRVLTYQFTQAGQSWFFLPKPVFLFFTLLILYLMGNAIEEEWGTYHFIGFFLLSTVVSAGLAGWLGVGLLGSYFVRYTLLFVYAAMYPDQTFYLFAVVPIRVRWLAYITAALLVYAAVVGEPANIAVLGGAAAGYLYFILSRENGRRPVAVSAIAADPVPEGTEFTSVRNAARFVAIRRAVSSGSEADLDRLIAQSEREKIAGVNICPPADFKPEATDGYCIRCEGFAECSARFMRASRVHPVTGGTLPETTR